MISVERLLNFWKALIFGSERTRSYALRSLWCFVRPHRWVLYPAIRSDGSDDENCERCSRWKNGKSKKEKGS